MCGNLPWTNAIDIIIIIIIISDATHSDGVLLTGLMAKGAQRSAGYRGRYSTPIDSHGRDDTTLTTAGDADGRTIEIAHVSCALAPTTRPGRAFVFSRFVFRCRRGSRVFITGAGSVRLRDVRSEKR